MKLWEIFLLCFGISLDVLAICICEGSMLPKINKRRLAVMTLIISAIDTVCMQLGHYVSELPRMAHAAPPQAARFWCVIAALIFLGLAVWLVLKALLRKPLHEYRSLINYRRVIVTSLFTGIDAFLVGFGSSLLSSWRLITLLSLFLITALCTVVGVFIGFHFGYEQRNKAYWCGAAVFLAAAIDALVTFIL